MSGSIREPSFEAKMLLEAIQDEADYLRLVSPSSDWLAAVLESLGDRFVSKVCVKD